MAIPVSVWADLDAEAKRDRLLDAARELFIREGLDAPMEAIARAAGAGVGSVYRLFATKEDLVAALVVRRMAEAQAELDAVLEEPDAWTALTGALRQMLEVDACDDVTARAIAVSSERSEVRLARQRFYGTLETLLARARAQGAVRADAGVLDVRLLFAAAPAAEALEPGSWRRVFELMTDALRAA